MVVAILLVLMVTLIGVTAVSQTLDSSYRAAVTNTASELVAAARAGADAEVANLEQEAAAGQSLTCLSGGAVDSAGGGAANAASVEEYGLTYYAVDTSASQAVADLAGSETTGPRYSCSGTPTITGPSGASTWYLAIESVGTTSAKVYYTAHPTIAVVSFAQGNSANFNDGLYGGEEINTPGNMVMTGSGATYTNGQLQCNSTNHYWAGDVWANGGVTSGDCQIRGNLYVNGAVDMTGCTAPDVTGGIFATGAVWMSGGCEVEGDIVSNGDVAFSGGADTLGNIYAFGRDASSTSLVETSLSSGLSTGAPVTTLPVQALPGSISAGTTIVVTSGSDTQSWTASASASSGATSISVASQAPNDAYPAGSDVETLGSPCGTSVCLQSGAGKGSSYQADNVYSANGTIEDTNAPVSGTQYPNTAWPTCPAPGGSGVSCSGGKLAPLPVQLFPSLSYQASMWPSGTWTYYDDSSDTCTSNPNGIGLASTATYNEIENPSSSHVVIYTPCALQVDDAATGGQLQIKANMAIFAAGGFFFDNWKTPAVTGGGSCTSSSKCDVYFVVPCNNSCDNSGAGPFPANGQGSTCPGGTSWTSSLSSALPTGSPVSSLPVKALPSSMSAGTTVYLTYAKGSTTYSQAWTVSSQVAAGATSIPVSSQTPNYAYPKGSTITYLSGDILMQSGVDGSSLISFFYTPNNFCASGTPGTSGDPIMGQIYVGGYVQLASQLFLDADTVLSSSLGAASSAYAATVVGMK
jgi:hypothetical protein